MRVLSRAAILAAVIACLGASTALATTVDYSADGNTFIVTGDDNTSHQIQFRGTTSGDDILDNQPITAPGDCAHNTPNWVSCPGHVGVQVDLNAGNDEVTFTSQGFDCFNDYVLNFGDGTNSLSLSSNCPTDPVETATVTSGSG